jgi:hypothetical protein
MTKRAWIILSLVLLAGIAFIWGDEKGFKLPNSSTKNPTSPAPTSSSFDWLYTLAGPLPVWQWLVLAIVALLIYRNRRTLLGAPATGASVSISLPKTGSVFAQIIISFAVLTTFFYLLSKIFPNAPLFNTDEGHGHLAMYYLLGALIALVAANFKGKAWFINTALIVLMFALLGHRTAELLDPSGRLFANIHLPSSNSAGTQVASATNPQCPGGLSEPTLTGDRLFKVTNNACQVRVTTDSDLSCAFMYDKRGTYVGKGCGKQLSYVNGLVYYLSAPQGEIVYAEVTSCPLGSPGRNMGSCN